MPDPQDRPKVFISHSTKDKTARKLLQLLYDQLKAHNFEPLADMNLKPGEGWRALIDGRIWECDAVIILSQDALRSRYVFYEAMYLRRRRAGDHRGARERVEADLTQLSEAGVSTSTGALISRLQSVLDGTREPALADSPNLSYDDSVELLLLLEAII